MPIYGYECEQCGHQLEVLAAMSDPPLKTCPECLGRLRKLFYPAGMIFKGSGFYTTDYKNSGSRSDSKSESRSESRSESKSESKSESSESKSEGRSESKSDTKPESKPAPNANSKSGSGGGVS